MTRALDISQTEKIKSGTLVPLDLIRLTTYTDRTAKTGATLFHFSDRAVRYDYANEGTNREYWPLLEDIGELSMSMNHLPSVDDSEIVRRRVSVTLSNSTVQGSRLAEILTAENLVGAEIEWRQLLVGTSDLAAHRVDLSSLDGDEATVFFRGQVNLVGPITNESFGLECSTELAGVNWGRANGADTDPRDVGSRLATCYGQSKRVRATNYQVGHVTTLTGDVGTSATGVFAVTDTSGFPSSGSFTILMGFERATASVTSGTSINITARGQSSTTAISHPKGDQVSELISEAVFVLAEHPTSQVSDVLINTRYGRLVSVDGIGTVNTFDTGSPVPAGEAWTTLRMSASELADLAAVVSQKLSTEDTGSTVTTSTFESNGSEISVPFGTGGSTQCDGRLLGGTTDRLTAEGIFVQNYGLSYEFSGSFSTNTVSRWKIVIKGVDIWVAGGLGGNRRFRFGGLNFTGGQPDDVIFDEDRSALGTGLVSTGDHESSWHTPTSSVSLNTLLNSGDLRWGQLQGASAALEEYTEIDEIGITAETAPAPFTVDVVADNGFGLELFCDVSGYVAPTATPAYKAGSGALMSHPCDIIRHWIEVIGSGTVDSDSYDDLETNLGGASWAFDTRTLGLDWESVLARMGFEARANIIPEETSSGVVWKMLSASSAYAFPASSAPVTEWEPARFAVSGVPLVQGTATRFAASYKYDANEADGEAAFAGFLRADVDSNDLTTPNTAALTAAEAAIGIVIADPMGFRLIRDEATAKDLLGYYASERIRRAEMFTVSGVPWWEGYTLEPGDVISVTPPWSESSRKLRVLSVTKDRETGLVNLRAVEVA